MRPADLRALARVLGVLLEDREEASGMLTTDGTRRCTPGGHSCSSYVSRRVHAHAGDCSPGQHPARPGTAQGPAVLTWEGRE